MIKKITYYLANANQTIMDNNTYLDIGLALNRKKELNNPDMELFQYVKEYKNKEFKNKFEKELELIKNL